jgi:hypothetical protein
MTPCPHCGATKRHSHKPDARAAQWRTRIRLYAAAKPDEPLADTDPERPPDAPGTMVLRGLPEVATILSELAASYHGTACVGLDLATLLHKLRGLRPTLSRRGGDAVWRLGYQVAGREYRARVNVERVRAGSEQATGDDSASDDGGGRRAALGGE